MAMESKDNNENTNSASNGVEKQQVHVESTDDRAKTSRNPRWTRHETFILINGKKAVENQVRRGRRPTISLGSDHLEPKWDSISSYCKHYGVNRGPVQCRKRWSNLLCDFKKIQAWESQIKEETESFWIMRNDLRREKRLPGLFNREVYDVLDGKAVDAAAYPLSLIIATDANNGNGFEPETEEEEEENQEETEAVFSSGPHATTEGAMLLDFEPSGQEELGWSPEKETNCKESSTKTVKTPLPFSDMGKEKHSGPNIWKESTCQEKQKRRRVSSKGCEATINLGDQMINILERNGNMLNAHFEAHNMNCQLEREQRKEHTDKLLAALSKIADALVKIAEKL